MPTISDVAAVAGVSPATVSRVLNGRPDVADVTRDRVLQAAQQLGYLANKTRHGTGTGHGLTFSVIAHGVDNEYIGTLIRGILDELDQSMIQAALCLSDVKRDREAQYVGRARDLGNDGLLIITPLLRVPEIRTLVGIGIPYVLIDAYPDSPLAPCVRCTNWQGARDATDYLLAHGHRRIGFIGGRRGDNIAEAREHGYRSALAEAGVEFAPELVRYGDYMRDAGYLAAQELLALPDRPTAIFACADVMAMGTYEAAAMVGLRVPDDVSVVGFDDLPLAQTLHPPLTTVRQPLYEMGRMAAQMVATMARGEELVSPQIELPTRLVIRDSCNSSAQEPPVDSQAALSPPAPK